MFSAILKRLLRGGHCEAICVTMDEFSRPNPAPMGVEYIEGMYGGVLMLRVYPGSLTLRNLMINKELTINFTNDAITFYDSVLRKERVAYRKSSVIATPSIKGLSCPVCSVECEVLSLTKGVRDTFTVISRPVAVGGSCPPPGSVSRASWALIDALIYFTKLKALANYADAEVITGLIERVLSDYELIMRLGSEDLREAIENVLINAWSYAINSAQYRV